MFDNESSAVAEMGDRSAAIDMGRKVGAAVPLSGSYITRRLIHTSPFFKVGVL